MIILIIPSLCLIAEVPHISAQAGHFDDDAQTINEVFRKGGRDAAPMIFLYGSCIYLRLVKYGHSPTWHSFQSAFCRHSLILTGNRRKRLAELQI